MPLFSSKGKTPKEDEKNGHPPSPEVIDAPPAYDALPADNGLAVANGRQPSGHPDQPAKAAVPAPDITAAFANLRIDNAVRAPNVDIVLAHLKLLHAFHALKEDVGYTDGLFEIWDSRADSSDDGREVTEDERMLVLSKLREKRWALYVARAVDRYEAWWTSQFRPELTTAMMLNPGDPRFEQFPKNAPAPEWSPNTLVPLDVLMVFHSHLLNPRNFLEDCIRFNARNFWARGMPWALVNQAIDTNFNYTVHEETKAAWVAQTGKNWDNLEDPLIKKIKCPFCSTMLEIPWTTCGLSEKDKSGRKPGIVGEGYGDGELNHFCTTCMTEIVRDHFIVAKFVMDAKLCIANDIAMPGTLLDRQLGSPLVVHEDRQWLYPRTVPNRIVKRALQFQIVELLQSNPKPTMQTVKTMFEDMIKDQVKVDHVQRNPNNLRSFLRSYQFNAPTKFAIRKTLSAYWDNPSVFCMGLEGAVMRQGIFVDKMVKIDWLHSPSVVDTAGRLLRKYDRFFQIMASYPANMAVPTLDVDLAWHTHQLTPSSYFTHSCKLTHKFIDHDDKLEESRLNTAFEWTSKVYQEKFGEVYSECTCWYCETVRTAHTSSLGKLLGVSSQEKVADSFHTSGAADRCRPDNSAHISAHNAIRIDIEGVNPQRSRVIRQAQATYEQRMNENYAKACKRAEKKGRKLPPKEEYYDHWGYRYHMYGPYVAPMYFAGGLYAAGAVGVVGVGYYGWASCAAGACSTNAVAAGACGGSAGVSACASGAGVASCGGASGGCGSGGCGGGGGGGGGGGCGGGGGGGGGCGGGGG